MKKYLYIIIAILFIAIFVNSFSLYANDLIHLKRGALYEKQGRYKEAIKEYKMELQKNPTFIELYQKIGYMYRFNLKDNIKAIEIYLDGLTKSPNNFSLNRDIMYSYFDEGNIESGLNIYRKISIMKGEKDKYSFTMDIIEKHFESLTEKEKIDFCKKYLKLNPSDNILIEKTAKIYFDKRDYQNAKKYYEKLIQYGNNIEFIYFSLAVCDFYLGSYEKSLKSFSKAKELGANVPEIYFEKVKEKIKGKYR